MSRGGRKLPLQVVLAVSFVMVATAAIAFLGVQRYVWVTGTRLAEELEQDRSLARAVAMSADRYVASQRQLADAVAKELEGISLDDRVALQAVVDSITRRNRSFAAFGVTDRHGVTVVASPAHDAVGRPAAGRGYADRPWFTDVVRTGRQQSYDVMVGKVMKQPVVVVSAPIRTRSGDLAGVVSGGMALDQLRSLIRDINPGIKDRLVLVDAAGRVIAHSSREWEAEAHDLSSEEVFLASRRTTAGAASDPTWGSFVRVPSTSWVVWTARAPELSAAKVQTLVSELVVSGCVAILLSAIAAILVSRAFSRPLRALADASRGVSDRRFHLEAVEPYRDSRIAEFSQLVARFGEMAESIEAQYEDLEGRVAERTQALERQTHDAQAAASALRVQEQIERGYSELAELLNSLDRSHILEHGTAKIAASLDAPVAAVYLTSSGPDTLRLKTYTVVDPTALRTPHLSATGLPHEVARRKAPVILSLREETERIMLATGVGEIPIHTIAGVPLTYQDRLLGVLVVATLTPLSEHARAFLDNAARQLSVALSNAGLFESARYQSQQMEQLNAALKRASDVKSEFLASMSHELRTPLNSIIGFTELLLSGGRDQLAPRHRAALEKVLASGRHLLGLINDILDLSKIEAGRMEMRPEPVRVAALAEECLSVIQPQARVKALPVELGEIDPDLTIQQDRGKLKQILLNLLSNAVKFTSEGRIELRAEGHGDELAIAVTDTGVGILLEDQGRMFEPFSRRTPRGVGVSEAPVSGSPSAAVSPTSWAARSRSRARSAAAACSRCGSRAATSPPAKGSRTWRAPPSPRTTCS
jgi:signal transduction histidine kinase/HAMP domain-containing protein